MHTSGVVRHCAKLGLILFASGIAFAIALTPGTAHAQLANDTQRVILKLRDGVAPHPQGVLASYQNHPEVETQHLQMLSMVILELPANWDLDVLIEALAKDPAVEYAVRDQALQVQGVRPNDLGVEQWGLDSANRADVNAPEAWGYTTGSTEVVVAVLDTGIDYTHPDLRDNMWVNEAERHGEVGVDDDGNGFVDDIHGYDFISDDGNPWDDADDGHGTGVAGVIAAQGNNGFGTVGTAWDLSLMALKVNDNQGGNISHLIMAANYVINMKRLGVNVRVINISLGTPLVNIPTRQEQQNLLDIIERVFATVAACLEQEGILVIFAAANGGGNVDRAPPGLLPRSMLLTRSTQNNIIVVANSHYDGSRNSGSNYGLTSVDLAAPGTDIYVPDSRINGVLGAGHAGVLFDGAETENIPNSRLGWSSTLASSSFQAGRALPTSGNVWTNEAVVATTPIAIQIPGQIAANFVFIGESVLRYGALDLSAFPPPQPLYLNFKVAYELVTTFSNSLTVQARESDGTWTSLRFVGRSDNPSWVAVNVPIYSRFQGSTPFEFRFVLLGLGHSSDSAMGDILVPAGTVFMDDISIRRAEDASLPATRSVNGTSFATPFVAGAAALLASHRPDLNYLQIREAILDNVQRRGGWDTQVASGGVLDVAAALASVTTPALVVTPERPTFFNRQPTTLTVALTREPGALPAHPDESKRVVVRVISRGDAQVNLQPSTLTFTADNWHVPQPVVVTTRVEGSVVDLTEQVALRIGVVADDSDSAYHGLATEIAADALAVTQVRLTPRIAQLGETITARVELNRAATIPIALSMTVRVDNPMASTEVTTQIAAGARSATLTFTPELLDLGGITEQVRAEVTLTATRTDTGELLSVPPVPALRITPDALLRLRLRTFLEGALR